MISLMTSDIMWAYYYMDDETYKKAKTIFLVVNIVLYSFILGYVYGMNAGIEKGWDFCKQHPNDCKDKISQPQYDFENSLIHVEQLNLSNI